jgi:nitrite reductase/ring-hydroxylating ferredoxin subunit
MTAADARAVAEPVDVCALDALPEGQVTQVTVGERPAGAVRLGDRVYVFGALCPHRGGPLVAGKVAHHLDGECPGDVRVDRDRPTVACPWHGWEFALADGRAVADPKYGMRVYDVEVRDRRVLARPRRAA